MKRVAFGVALLLVIVLGLPGCGKPAEEGSSGAVRVGEGGGRVGLRQWTARGRE